MDVRFCDDWAGGFSWIVDEPMTRTSHALVEGGRVWLVDPVDWAPAVERAAAAGTPAAVLQLLDRHNRDCAALAARLGVAHLVVPGAVAGSPFEVVDVRRARRWREVALWWPERSTLVVAEAVGTNAFYAPRGPAGVHLLLRPAPPREQLDRFRPEHLLVGHGEGLHGADAAAGLQQALATARTGLAGVLLALPRLALAARRAR